jgi:hypothetical protein
MCDHVIIWLTPPLPSVIKCDHFAYSPPSPHLDHEILEQPLSVHYKRLFLLSLLSGAVTFLPELVIVGFQNFVWDFKSQKNKIWGKANFGGTPCPPRGSIF